MATYAIGDVQGCYDPLRRLLDEARIDLDHDTLWFAGDLVNRGPQSLEVLRFIQQLPKRTVCVLGNHDLHLLALVYATGLQLNDDTLEPILNAPDCLELAEWLRHRPLIHQNKSLGYTLVHAGIPPNWSINEAIAHAAEVTQLLRSDKHTDFLEQMYGNQPNQWNQQLQGYARARMIINALTRMRFCDADSRLDLVTKGPPNSAKPGLAPWFEFPHKREPGENIIFGHWAALNGKVDNPNLFAIDTGCVWGGALSALRLEDKKIFHVAAN
jgi:bis(5'-nucleosyl)-tetraphosphatase (symmetrical)